MEGVRVRILVVDADIAAARDLASHLGAEHEVSTASASEAAMLAVCRSRPHLVLLRPNPSLALAERILTAMSALGDLKLAVHHTTFTKDDLDRILGDCH